MSKRTDQVSKTVQHEVALSLAEVLPRGALVTVTGVEVSPDLKQATVWVSVIGDNEAEVLEQIRDVKREVQRAVNARMTTKFVPKLSFELDHGGQYADRINRVLKDL